MQRDLTQGSILKNLFIFAVPYLISSFLQTFYGLADLFITGQFNGAATISAVSIGSQIMHMLTVVIVGLAMGTTVRISHAVGAKNNKAIRENVGNTISIFIIFAIVLVAILLLSVDGIIHLISTPTEAVLETRQYLIICFIGIPFITAYNVISSIFRGLGDTKSPMYFVAVAGVINIILDYILIGPCQMGAKGAAIATVIAQALSVLFALCYMRLTKSGVSIGRKDLAFQKETAGKILNVGIPIAFQEGIIQISFLVITAIANSRGVDVAAAVGIVEKIISFLFLVPSSMLSTVSATAAQNAGAGKHERGRVALRYGILVCMTFGLVVFIACQFVSEPIVGLFVKNDAMVILLGGQYLRSYSIDCMIAGIHFCFSGFFSAYGKSFYSFFHNIVSVIAVRVPGAYLASVYFPKTLYPMGLAAPMGSLLSVIICIILFRIGKKAWSVNS